MKIAPEVGARACELREAGMPYVAIAAELEISSSSAYWLASGRKRKYIAGVRQRQCMWVEAKGGQGRVKTSENREAAICLRRQGMTLRAIATQLGASLFMVQLWCNPYSHSKRLAAARAKYARDKAARDVNKSDNGESKCLSV